MKECIHLDLSGLARRNRILSRELKQAFGDMKAAGRIEEIWPIVSPPQPLLHVVQELRRRLGKKPLPPKVFMKIKPKKRRRSVKNRRKK